jgi:hypothetical protein
LITSFCSETNDTGSGPAGGAGGGGGVWATLKRKFSKTDSPSSASMLLTDSSQTLKHPPKRHKSSKCVSVDIASAIRRQLDSSLLTVSLIGPVGVGKYVDRRDVLQDARQAHHSGGVACT